ncbi:Lantibiotic dehydratase OS=Streptomyces microflavus OX=1919 GN=Smic_64470 PE=4 SV=1 [Streptomyces microflavus]
MRVHAASLEDLQAARRVRLEVVSVSRGAGVSTGRFLGVLAPSERQALTTELADLPAADSDTVSAQLSFPAAAPGERSCHPRPARSCLPC